MIGVESTWSFPKSHHRPPTALAADMYQLQSPDVTATLFMALHGRVEVSCACLLRGGKADLPK
jgi:hypothetical protein